MQGGVFLHIWEMISLCFFLASEERVVLTFFLFLFAQLEEKKIPYIIEKINMRVSNIAQLTLKFYNTFIFSSKHRLSISYLRFFL